MQSVNLVLVVRLLRQERLDVLELRFAEDPTHASVDADRAKSCKMVEQRGRGREANRDGSE